MNDAIGREVVIDSKVAFPVICGNHAEIRVGRIKEFDGSNVRIKYAMENWRHITIWRSQWKHLSDVVVLSENYYESNLVERNSQ